MKINFLTSLVVPFLLVACTTPVPPPLPLPPPPPLPRAQTYEPEKKSSSFFTVGSTMDEVTLCMGTPHKVERSSFLTTWHYHGNASVTFIDGRVSEWQNARGSLKARVWSSINAGEYIITEVPVGSYNPSVSPPELTSLAPRPSAPTSYNPAPPPPEPIPLAPRPSAVASPDSREIDARVATILAGNHTPLPPAQRMRSDPTASVAQMTTRNNTAYVLTVLYSGPTSQRVVLAPRTSGTVLLGVGAYQVAATVDSSSVIPFAGRDSIGGGSYDNTFYIQTTPRW